MSSIDREELIEAAAGAFREQDADGNLQSAPAWHDLDEQGRQEAFETAIVQRKLEAAADPEGLSSTARAVLRRILGKDPRE